MAAKALHRPLGKRAVTAVRVAPPLASAPVMVTAVELVEVRVKPTPLMVPATGMLVLQVLEVNWNVPVRGNAALALAVVDCVSVSVAVPGWTPGAGVGAVPAIVPA